MSKIKAIMVLLLMSTANASVLQAVPTITGINPGSNGTITITLSNTGTDIAYDTKIVMRAIDTPLTSEKLCTQCNTYSNLEKRCTDYATWCYINAGDVQAGNNQIINYKISIPENIEEGTYFAYFDVHYGSINATTREVNNRRKDVQVVLEITNINAKPEITIKSVSAPEELSPGQEFNITVTIENTGKIKAQKVNTELITNDFQTKGMPNNIIINELSPGTITEKTFTLISDAAINPGVKKITYQVSYTDNKETYSTTTTSGILIDGKTEFTIYLQDISPSIITKDTIINSLISIANTGIINAKSVTIKINENEQIITQNVKQDFLGDLDVGDFTTTSLEFKTLNEGMIEIPLTIEYTTPSGDRITQNITEKAVIRYTQQATEQKTIGFSDIILIIGTAALLLYLLKKRKSKK